MDFEKLDATLALALQESEGPFKVIAVLSDKSLLVIKVDKAGVEKLIHRDDVVNVRLATRLKSRRKIVRAGDKDRRND